jgi:flagellar biosynthetic protein FliP
MRPSRIAGWAGALACVFILASAPAAWAQSAAQDHAAAVQPAAASAPKTAPDVPARNEPLALLPHPPQTTQTADVVRIAVILTLLGLLPAIAICMTPFVRFVVVLSMVRHAFGMPETPPNQVLVSLALFLTLFVMAPTLTVVNRDALQPFLADSIPVQTALDRGAAPLKTFMLRQVHDQDLKTVYDISKRPLPASASQVGLMDLTAAFMLNELRVSFRIGFVVMLPFLLIDLVVSSILLSLGMMMVPPATLSLPIKVLMFVLIDGWSLILEGVAGSFR